MKLIAIFCLILIVVCFAHSAEAGYVPKEIQCPPYEVYYACGSPCQTECATLGQKCRIVNIRCPDGCYCVDGYARNACGKCIPIEQCPAVSTVSY